MNRIFTLFIGFNSLNGAINILGQEKSKFEKGEF